MITISRLYILAAFTAIFGTNAIAEDRQAIINSLLLSELESPAYDAFPPSWAFSNEGGFINYAEVDLIGDNTPEVFYYRSNQGELYRLGAIPQVYAYDKDGSAAYMMEDGIFLEGFHKKEDGRSIILKASAGDNYDTPDEKAFTKKLFIQEVTSDGIVNTVHLIDDTSSREMRELWESSNYYYDKKSIDRMEELGYKYYKPEYEWISLKGYLNGGKWADYVDNGDEWNTLSAFSIDSMAWRVRRESVTPEYLDFSKSIHSLVKANESKYTSGLPSDIINFPKNYFLPADALISLNELIAKTGKVTISDKPEGRAKDQPHTSLSDNAVKNRSQQKETANSGSQTTHWKTIALIGIGLTALLGIALGVSKLNSRS